jgi:hypothetical protein
MLALDVRCLQRDGWLTRARVFHWKWTRNGEKVASICIRAEADHMVLNYQTQSNGGEWQPMEYSVHLEWTGLHLGGQRVWFLCPTRGCGRRVAILYGGINFACRHCHKLKYQCQREAHDYRAARRADRIREKLGWQPGILNPISHKPIGMQWRTFERLKAEHDAFMNVTLAGIIRRLRLKIDL